MTLSLLLLIFSFFYGELKILLVLGFPYKIQIIVNKLIIAENKTCNIINLIKNKKNIR